MRAMWRVMFGVLGLFVVAPAAYAQSDSPGQGGMNQYPRNDNEARLIRRDLPVPVKISRATLRGDVVTRGRRIQRARGTPGSDCVFDFGFEVELYSGSREVVLQPQPDCTVTVDSITDVDVVEPQQYAVARVTPGIFAAVKHVTGRLWEALFPTAYAQAPALKTLYHHIYTCGIACAGGADGLTAQQGWLNYQLNLTQQVKLDTAYGWWCTAGSSGGSSYCQPPLATWGAPMVPVNTGWSGFGGIMYRNWGPGTEVSAGDYSVYQWLPAGITVPTFVHTLYNERKANYNGGVSCVSYISGSIVNGPVRSNCVAVPR